MQPKTLVIVPCYKRPEYTEMCIRSLEESQEYENTTFYLVDDGSKDGTEEILKQSKFERKFTLVNNHNRGLRNVLMDAFKFGQEGAYHYIVKMDNDCVVPANWLNRTLFFLNKDWADIVSPNVLPSNAAMRYGRSEEEGKPGIRPSRNVGGLWAMRTSLLDGIFFEQVDAGGIRGAFSLLNQIIVEKDPRVGWLPEVTVQDVGHWSGAHPSHIKSEEHLEYSAEIGREVSWA